MNTLIKKADVPGFFEGLLARFEVIAPVDKRGVIRFLPITDYSDIDFSRQSDYSPKKYLLPSQEDLFSYKHSKAEVNTDSKQRILVTRPCDSNAILNMDRVFLDEHPDPYYRAKRENTLLLVFKCATSYKNCFCTSVNADETINYDLLFVDIGDKYVVSVGNSNAQDLIDHKLFTNIIRDGKVTLRCKRKLVNHDKLAASLNSKTWKAESKRCLSCNACISACPSCFCFTVRDEPSLDLTSGNRTRHWDYCYMEDHTRVAGGFVFRKERWKRFRHRIYHQLKYFKDGHGRQLCVGCGRCINVCPTDIDMVEIISTLE